ncbi:hypothetical protein A0J61_10610, partial [Choanephora cucurbitarum]
MSNVLLKHVLSEKGDKLQLAAAQGSLQYGSINHEVAESANGTFGLRLNPSIVLKIKLNGRKPQPSKCGLAEAIINGIWKLSVLHSTCNTC